MCSCGPVLWWVQPHLADPKSGGDATLLGHRPLCVLPVVQRVWASAWMIQLEPWFRPWVPASVFGAGGERSSVDA